MRTTTAPIPASVAPFTGAWIETSHRLVADNRIGASRPSRARGLKLKASRAEIGAQEVAPFTGAWIETRAYGSAGGSTVCRALHGRVD